MRPKFVNGLLLALSIAAAGPAFADPKSTSDAVDKAVQTWMQDQKVTSAEVAVSFHGNMVGSYGHGGWKPQDPHLLASLSKAITAICLAQFVDQGKLSLKDTLGALLEKDFAKYGEPTDKRFKGITVEQLLTHRAGLDKNTFGNATTMVDAFKVTAKTALINDPGSKFFYSDSGYLLLGFVAEHVSGAAYAKTCLKPLTDIGGTGSIEPSLAERAPNGGWKVSAVDYLKLLKFFDSDSNLLGSATKAWLRAPTGGNYSWGAFLKKTKAGVQLNHTGIVHHDKTHPMTGGSYYIVDPSGYTVVVIFSNEMKPEAYDPLIAAIDKALASDTPATATPVAVGNPAVSIITAKIDGTDWASDDVIPSYTNFGGKPVFNFSGRHYGKVTSFFTFNLMVAAGGIPKGSFVFDRTKPLTANTGNYTSDPNPVEILEHSYPFDTGQVVVESYDAVHKTINGTFSGNAKSRSGQALKITGKFTGVPFDPSKVK